MAPAFEIRPGQPDLLIVYDDDIYNSGTPNFGLLHAFLDDPPAGCPVSRGSHDYWLVHAHPPSDAGSAKVGENDSITPRPLRAEIQMLENFEGTLDADAARMYVDTVAQEVAHYWLAYADRFRVGGESVVPSHVFMEAVNTGVPIPDLCLLGRSDEHWSSFLQADASPLDGEHWDELGDNHEPEGRVTDSTILRHYRQRSIPGPDISVPGIPGMVTTGQTYSDLDLMVIGVISAEDAYPGSGGTFDYLTPQWELGNLTFQGGLALLFDTNDIVLFGFEAGFTHLVVQRTGDAPQSFDLGGTYQPWSFEQRMLLRIVRRGNNYYFQGRPERGSIGCLGELLRPFSGVLRRFGVTWPPPPMDPFSDLGSLPAAPTATVSATDWNTFAILPISQTPRGLAYLVKTYPNTIPVVDFSGRSLQILAAGTPGRPPRLTVSDVTSTAAGSTASNYLDLLQTGTYTYHEPRDGPLKIDGDGWHRLIVTTHRVEADGRLTEIGPFNHTDTVDDAPKLATAAPAGDFAVAGSIRLERDTMGPGSGGAHTGMELWAYRHRININDVQLTHEAISRQALPMDGKYAAAFIIVAGSVPQRREKVAELPDSVVDNVDRLRRAWEDYFPKATRNSRFFDTRLTRS